VITDQASFILIISLFIIFASPLSLSNNTHILKAAAEEKVHPILYLESTYAAR